MILKLFSSVVTKDDEQWPTTVVKSDDSHPAITVNKDTNNSIPVSHLHFKNSLKIEF